jgi:hypothetical protein
MLFTVRPTMRNSTSLAIRKDFSMIFNQHRKLKPYFRILALSSSFSFGSNRSFIF